MKYKFHPERTLRHIISFPFIWMMLFPLVFFDILLEIYHNICFYMYGINKINRWDYIRIDRHRLMYLSMFDKLNCMYCGYANGLLHYGSTIAGETEKYWCAIKHQPGNFKEPAHHKDFLPYGDDKAFNEMYNKQCRKK
ncbi:MAG: hypothetical protein HGA85_02570 [Nanoarchaeota archaeon]|nr:hypothetical protein [Nanoarchaeota archaeon]